MLLVPRLKRSDCSDHDPIEEWVPDTDDVYYCLTLHIGTDGSDAADMFHVMVATPSGLASAKQRGERIGPHSPIVVNPYSWDAVMHEVTTRLELCEPDVSWAGLTSSLRRHFAWEYDNYR